MTFVAAVLDAAEGAGPMSEAVALLREAEDRERIRFVHEDERDRYPNAPCMDWQTSDAILVERLGRICSALHFVISGMDFTNDHVVVLPEGLMFEMTQREWGSYLASWAARSGWMAHRPDWTEADYGYAEFYIGTCGFSEADYRRWADALLPVLRHQEGRPLWLK